MMQATAEVWILAAAAVVAAHTPSVTQSPFLPAPSSSSTTECEVHVWPTRNGVADVRGMASVVTLVGFLADGAAHKKANRAAGAAMVDKISPQSQAAAMMRKDVLAALRLPAATRVVVEETLPAYQEMQQNPVVKQRVTEISAAVGGGTRLSSSQAPCYAELLVSGLGYARSPLDPPVLTVRWIFRRWNGAKSADVIGWRQHRLPAGLKTIEDVDAAPDATMADMYATALIEWAHKKLKA